jgi:hypothetical protein
VKSGRLFLHVYAPVYAAVYGLVYTPPLKSSLEFEATAQTALEKSAFFCVNPCPIQGLLKLSKFEVENGGLIT